MTENARIYGELRARAGYPPLGPLLRGEVEAFLAVSGTKLSILGEEAAGNPSFAGRLRKGVSPRLATFDRVRAWMAANASEDELRAIRERLADVADPFAGRGEAAACRTQAPPADVEAGVSAGEAREGGSSGRTRDARRVQGQGGDPQPHGGGRREPPRTSKIRGRINGPKILQVG